MMSSEILRFDRYSLSSLSEIRRSAAFVVAFVRFNNPIAKIIVPIARSTVHDSMGLTLGDILARRVPVIAFCRHRVSLKRRKARQKIIGLND
jgi:hypothetical protein